MEAEDVARGGAAPGPPRPGLVPISIIGAEDEDFEIELKTNPEEQNNQFQNLDQVKRRPAHLMALLQHVAMQFEPGPLLCCLHADMLGSLGPKEFKKAFIDFYHSFLDKHSILRVMVPPAVAFELGKKTKGDFGELQRQFVQEVVQSQQVAVVRQLEDFRSKKLMGMTPWEQELVQLGAWVARDRASYEARERHLAERQLTHLEEMQHTISNDEEKSAAVVNAISLYMRHLGVRTKSGDKKSGRNFFRKKMIGNRRSDEPTKTKKGLSSFLDAARWNRGETQDIRNPKVEVDAEKPGLTERKGGQGAPSRDRNLGGPGQDSPGVSPHPLSGDSPDREPGVDALLEVGDPPPQGPASLEAPAPLESTEEAADTESPEPGDEGEPGRSGLELEPEEPPGWRELVPQDILHSLPKSQVKRQEVINELLVTEAAHVRMLRVLHDVFYQPMAEGGFYSQEELQNIFPSLDELIEVHCEYGAVFDGPEGSWFQKISSRFCSHQSFALEQLKAKQRKEPRFCTFVQDAESRPRCRRLQLKDMIPTEMQRLTKYPLLLQSIGQNTEESVEREKVERAAECCREILQHVNLAVRDMEDLLRLKDYQRRLDLTHLRQSNDPMLIEFKSLDITRKRLIYEGPLTWRVTKDKAVEVHVLLLNDLLLLLQRQDERLLLKSHSRTLTPTPDGKTMLRPVLRLTSAMTREVATDHKAFYVIFTWDQEAQIYELVAQTVSERRMTKRRPGPQGFWGQGREECPGPGSGGSDGPGGWPVSSAGRMERLFTSLLPFSRQGLEGQLAAKALQKVLTLKQLLLPSEEDSGAGPPLEGDGVPGGSPSTPAQPQEIREELLSLEETIKQLEEVEEEFCRLRLLLSQLGENTVPQSGCT
uniref:DH domain-containing protein n=1 Tax=Capra hircus TaxID=9925 RepID=A0A8C2Y478_CAPHI